jgi:hypothetical protein
VASADALMMSESQPLRDFVEPTLYQGATFLRASMSVCIGLAALLGLSGVFAGSASISGLPLTIALLGGMGAIWAWRARQMGIRIESDRIIAVYAVGSRTFALDDVTGFSLHLRGNSGGTHVVSIDLSNGKRKPVPSVNTADWGPFKTDSIRWEGGRTDDVIARLTEHVARVRAASGS